MKAALPRTIGHRVAGVFVDDLHFALGNDVMLVEPEEMERGKYALGEGVTGNVVATGRARIIQDMRTEPDFLNRTGRLTPVLCSYPLNRVS